MKTPFLITAKGSNISESAVQAFAKLTGEDWTFYAQDLSVSIGRSSNSKPGDADDDIVDLDLGAKTISRRHAKISFNFTTRAWEILITGRNGLKIDNIPTKTSDTPIPLKSKYFLILFYMTCSTMLEIGGIQFIFTLPITPEEVESTKAVVEKPIKKIIEKAPKKMYPRENPPPNLIKPTPSYATLIAEAINTSPEKKMTLACIYNYIADNYEYYQYANNGWQVSLIDWLSI